MIANLLFVTVKVPATPGLTISPEGNILASVIFTQLLEAKIAAAGLYAAPVGFSGPFNQANFTVPNSDFRPAFRVVREALASIGLERQARIYRLDGSEMVLRCLYPENGNAVSLAELPELAMAVSAATPPPKG